MFDLQSIEETLANSFFFFFCFLFPFEHLELSRAEPLVI